MWEETQGLAWNCYTPQAHCLGIASNRICSHVMDRQYYSFEE